MTNENRRAAAARIRALLSKTVAAGCTEEEALAASELAGKLMDKWGIESSEVEVRAEKCETRSHASRAGKRGDRERRSGPSEVQSVALAIGRYCGCKVWKNGAEIKYFGLPHEAEVAAYMTDAIETAMRTSFRRWRKGPDRPAHVSGHKLRASFMGAMAKRLSERLDEMTNARNQSAPQTSDGKSLVLVRNAVVEEQFAELNMRLKRSHSRSYANYDSAVSAGRAAGDRHQFMDGVGRRSAGMIASR